MRRRRYSNLDIQMDLLYSDLLDPRNSASETREIMNEISALQTLKEKELDIESKRHSLGKDVDTDTLVKLAGRVAMFGGFLLMEKTNPLTLKNSLRFLSFDDK